MEHFTEIKADIKGLLDDQSAVSSSCPDSSLNEPEIRALIVAEVAGCKAALQAELRSLREQMFDLMKEKRGHVVLQKHDRPKSRRLDLMKEKCGRVVLRKHGRPKNRMFDLMKEKCGHAVLRKHDRLKNRRLDLMKEKRGRVVLRKHDSPKHRMFDLMKEKRGRAVLRKHDRPKSRMFDLMKEKSGRVVLRKHDSPKNRRRMRWHVRGRDGGRGQRDRTIRNSAPLVDDSVKFMPEPRFYRDSYEWTVFPVMPMTDANHPWAARLLGEWQSQAHAVDRPEGPTGLCWSKAGPSRWKAAAQTDDQPIAPPDLRRRTVEFAVKVAADREGSLSEFHLPMQACFDWRTVIEQRDRFWAKVGPHRWGAAAIPSHCMRSSIYAVLAAADRERRLQSMAADGGGIYMDPNLQQGGMVLGSMPKLAEADSHWYNPPSARIWVVTGGSQKRGIIVRSGPEVSSKILEPRLCVGTYIKEIDRQGDRIRFEKGLGSGGPSTGWVSRLTLGGQAVLELVGAKKVLQEACQVNGQ